MPVLRRAISKRHREQQLPRRIGEVILPAQHRGDTHERVVDEIREEERRRAVGTLQDEIPDRGALEDLLPVHEIDELDTTAVGHAETQGGTPTLGDLGETLILVEMSAGSCVARRASGGKLRLAADFDLERRAVARINAPCPIENLEGLAIDRCACRLVDGLAIPCEAEPGEIVHELARELGLAALGVGVFDAQQEAAARVPGEQPVEERCARVTEVQFAARARREAGDERAGGHPRNVTPTIEGVNVLFVSDLHLDAASPALVEAFVSFLAREAREAQALYILGDLFESWIGDDDPNPMKVRVCAALRSLSDAGVTVFALHGNRDFMLGEGFERRTGATLLPDPVVATIDGERILLTHGDLLCTGDTAYQELRTTVRDPAFRQRVLALPLEARQQLADAARAGSRAHTRATASDIMDVSEAAVIAAFEASATHTMIHGHTHRPGEHRHATRLGEARRIVLAAWDQHGEALRYFEGEWSRIRINSPVA